MTISEAERDSAVTAQMFSEEIVSAYNVIANSWIQAKEVKVMNSCWYNVKAISDGMRTIFSILSTVLQTILYEGGNDSLFDLLDLNVDSSWLE